MASGNYAKKSKTAVSTESRSQIPARATRNLRIQTEGKMPGNGPDTETFTFSKESASVTTTDPKRTASTPNAKPRTGKTITLTSPPSSAPRMISTTRNLSNQKAANPAHETRHLPNPYNPNMTRILPEAHEGRATRVLSNPKSNRTVDLDGVLALDTHTPQPLEHHQAWMKPWLICFIFAIISLMVLVSAGIFQRADSNLIFGGGQTYNIQVGGTQAKDWQKEKPEPIQKDIPHATGPYAVMGKPTISADFINRVLVNAGSPAAGKGQVFYNTGVQYGIDPAFALAFFQHESTFGTRGEARKTLSVGNLRCIPAHQCVDQDRGGYAQMASWDDGIKTWYALIRDLYVVQLGKDTIEKIIPTYAPNSDNNNEQAYIDSLKTAVDRWRAGVI